MNSLSAHVTSDLQVWEILKLYNMGKDVQESSIIRLGFDDGPGGLLYSTTSADGAYILLPRAGNFSSCELATKSVFDGTAPVVDNTPIPNKPSVNTNSAVKATTTAATEPTSVEVQNGTTVAGLAQKTADELKKTVANMDDIKNAPTRDYEATVVYSLRGEKSRDAAAKIARALKADLATAVPSWATATSSDAVSKTTDVLIILGTD